MPVFTEALPVPSMFSVAEIRVSAVFRSICALRALVFFGIATNVKAKTKGRACRLSTYSLVSSEPVNSRRERRESRILADREYHGIGLLRWREGTAALVCRYGERYWNRSTLPQPASLHRAGTTGPLSFAVALNGITPRDCEVSISPVEKADLKIGRQASIDPKYARDACRLR